MFPDFAWGVALLTAGDCSGRAGCTRDFAAALSCLGVPIEEASVDFSGAALPSRWTDFDSAEGADFLSAVGAAGSVGFA